MNGRHYKMLFIITMQYPLGIPPNLRTNIDYIFILRENIKKNKERIYDSYAGIFPSYDLFSQVMDQCTENYECLVIHNGSKTNRIEDCVFWYKAAPHPDFKIGSRDHWLKSAEYERMKEAAEAAGETGQSLSSSGAGAPKGPIVTVKKY